MPDVNCPGCGGLLVSADPADAAVCSRCGTVRPPRAPPNARPALSGLLRCDACGRTAECRGAELYHFAMTKWPECCGEVMSLFLPAGKPLGEPK
jgi:hypothetical protein